VLRKRGFPARRHREGIETREKSRSGSSSSERLVKSIRRTTRKQYLAEEKLRIVLDGLRGEASIAELCRREGIAGASKKIYAVKIPETLDGRLAWLHF
jgi:transposase